VGTIACRRNPPAKRLVKPEDQDTRPPALVYQMGAPDVEKKINGWETAEKPLSNQV